MTYKQVRITEAYLDKLRSIANGQKRSMTKMLEVLIDEAGIYMPKEKEYEATKGK